MALLCFFFNQLEVVAIIDGELATERVGAEVFDEGPRDLVSILKQQPFEMGAICKWTAVGHDARGINQWVFAHSR